VNAIGAQVLPASVLITMVALSLVLAVGAIFVKNPIRSVFVGVSGVLLFLGLTQVWLKWFNHLSHLIPAAILVIIVWLVLGYVGVKIDESFDAWRYKK
jgi:hypothetical protein